MAIKTIECVDCGAAVIYGRLSCSACGALLASVVGGRRGGVRVLETPSAPAAETVAKTFAEPVAETAAEPAPVQPSAPPKASVRARPASAIKASPKRGRAAALAGPGAALTTAEPAAEPVWKFASLAARETEVVDALDVDLAPEPPVQPEPDPAPEATTPEPTDEPAPDHSVAAFGAPSVDQPAPWAPLDTSEPILVARPYQRHNADGADLAYDGLTPGAYRPPGMPPAIAMTAAAASAGPATDIPARAPIGAATAATAAADVGASPTARARTGTFPSVKGRIDAGTLVEIAGWFVIVGATMSVLGFLLPWSVAVIGSSGVGGYFNSWGLASPSHLLVVIGLLVVLAIAVLDSRVPAWLGTGILGLAFGGLQIGLVWPYVVGPLGADVGVTVAALGGLALVIGGIVASWATRHVESEPGV